MQYDAPPSFLKSKSTIRPPWSFVSRLFVRNTYNVPIILSSQYIKYATNKYQTQKSTVKNNTNTKPHLRKNTLTPPPTLLRHSSSISGSVHRSTGVPPGRWWPRLSNTLSTNSKVKNMSERETVHNIRVQSAFNFVMSITNRWRVEYGDKGETTIDTECLTWLQTVKHNPITGIYVYMLLLNQDKNGILHNTLKHQLPDTSHYAGSLIRRHYAGNGGRALRRLWRAGIQNTLNYAESHNPHGTTPCLAGGKPSSQHPNI